MTALPHFFHRPYHLASTMIVRKAFISILLLAALDFSLGRQGGFSISNFAKVVRRDERLQNVIDYVQLKLGSHSKQSYWHYSGVLRNPLTGREIVGIEGVEVVRSAPVSPVYEGNTTAAAFLSKKLFMYVDRANASSLVEQYRLQRQAPLRPVKAISEIVEKVTLGIDDKGQTFASVTWPGSRRTITNNRIRIEPSPTSDSFLDRLVGRKKLNVVNFMTAGVPIQSIPQNSLRRWISFSPGGQDDRAGRSQEYYTISNVDSLPAGSYPHMGVNKNANSLSKQSVAALQRLIGATQQPDAVLTYQRHGEGPAWYAVGRACIVELTGARYASEKFLPLYVRDLVQRANPAFFDLSVPAAKVVTRHANRAENVSSVAAVAGVPARGNKKQTLLTLQWFDAQTDPAERYKPWYSHIGTCIASFRKDDTKAA